MFSFGFFYAGNRGRTGTEYYLRRILSPVRLPIPPLRHMGTVDDVAWDWRSESTGHFSLQRGKRQF